MDFDLTADQQAWLAEVECFARDEVAPHAAAIDAEDRMPRALVARAAGLGLLGLTAPASHGGAGRDRLTYVLTVEAVARASASLAVLLAVQNSLVVAPIAAFGTPAQQDRWLGPLASGAALGAFALSEAQAGTDAFNLETRATRDGAGYRIRGRKVWVANAAAADVAIVFAALRPEGGREVTAFLVPLDAEGVVRGQPIDALGVRGLGCLDLELADVAVEAAQVLGAPGEGRGVAARALDEGRVAIAAQAIGVGQAALDEALQHARTRETFGQPIGSRQAVQWMLADMATELDAARMLTWRAAALAGGRDAAMAKLLASDAAGHAANRALQIFASAGYRRGSRVERLFRDARGAAIYQGTSEAQRMIIAADLLDD